MRARTFCLVFVDFILFSYCVSRGYTPVIVKEAKKRFVWTLMAHGIIMRRLEYIY